MKKLQKKTKNIKNGVITKKSLKKILNNLKIKIT